MLSKCCISVKINNNIAVFRMCEQIINDALRRSGPHKFLQKLGNRRRAYACSVPVCAAHTHSHTHSKTCPESWELTASLCLQSWEKEDNGTGRTLHSCLRYTQEYSLTHLLLSPTPLQPPSHRPSPLSRSLL